MKKIIFFSAVLFLFAFVSGCGLKKENKAEEAKQFSIKDLKNQNIEQECTFTMPDLGEMGKLEYKILFKGDKMKIITDMNDTKYYLLNDEEFLYSWSDLNNTGVKMKSESESSVDNSDFEENSNMDMDAFYDFDCKKRKIDEKELEIPSDIDFTDFSQNLLQMDNFDSPANTSQDQIGAQVDCSICNFFTGEEKENCLVDLGC